MIEEDVSAPFEQLMSVGIRALAESPDTINLRERFGDGLVVDSDDPAAR